MRLYEILEGLDKDQRRVGQVGAKERAKKISPVLGNEPKKHPYNNRLVGEVAPKGWEGTVKAMKKHEDEIDNPWALAWWMKNQGYQSHKK